MPHPIALYFMFVTSLVAALLITGAGWVLLAALKWFAMIWVTTLIWALVCPEPLFTAPVSEEG